MSIRLTRAFLAIAVCLLVSAPAAMAGNLSKTGKSGQVYTWASGHC